LESTIGISPPAVQWIFGHQIIKANTVACLSLLVKCSNKLLKDKNLAKPVNPFLHFIAKNLPVPIYSFL
jgi:hypothetical protein